VTKFSDGDPRYLLTEQYQTDTNLCSRVGLHELFSTNPQGWHRWLFAQFEIPARARVLELGCGTGALWQANGDRIRSGWRVTLSDFSSGMVEACKARLATLADTFAWEVVDAQAIPYTDATFNVVIANHVLYHIPDRPQAIQEMCRVLSAGGRLYAAANGNEHMREIDDLVQFCAPETERDDTAMKFGLETGGGQLARCFASIDICHYPDALEVTEVEPLLRYVLSTTAKEVLDDGRIDRLRALIETEIARNGSFHVTKLAGLFRCRI